MPILSFVLGLATTLDTQLDELADAGLVEAGERVVVHHLGVLVGGQERARVVPAEAETGLGEVVGAEAEELGVLGHIGGGERRAWDLDHRADGVLELDFLQPVLLTHLRSRFVDDGLLELELFGVATSGTMISGSTLVPFAWTSAAASRIAVACILVISG